MRFAIRRRPDPLLDVTPMIDIVFQLVLFFMVSTTFVQSSGIQVDLPRSSAQTVVSDETDIQIFITLDGTVYVDDVPVSTAELRALLGEKGRTKPNTLVVLKADQGVEHGQVVAVMDMARTVGLAKIAIATETPTGDE